MPSIFTLSGVSARKGKSRMKRARKSKMGLGRTRRSGRTKIPVGSCVCTKNGRKLCNEGKSAPTRSGYVLRGKCK